MNRLIVIALLLGMVGCSSTKPIARSEQRCDMKSQTVSVKDALGRVTDEKTVEVMVCDDSPLAYVTRAKVGLAKKCFESPYRNQLPGGRVIEGRGYACQKYDGTWEIIDGRGLN